MKNAAAAKISQAWTVLSIHDTRTVEIHGDKVVRIPGSGELRPCDHCGSMHEVHVTLINGADEMIVGTSCARGLGKVNKVNKSFVHAAPFLVGSSARSLTWQGADGERFTTER